MFPYILTIVLSILGAWVVMRVTLNQYYFDNAKKHAQTDSDLLQLRKEHDAMKKEFDVLLTDAYLRWGGGK